MTTVVKQTIVDKLEHERRSILSMLEENTKEREWLVGWLKTVEEKLNRHVRREELPETRTTGTEDKG
jgi:hypothetical protein